VNTSLHPATPLPLTDTPRNVLESALAALCTGRISQALERFNDSFIFCDRALGLEFTDKARLEEFFRRSRELLPDTVLEVTATFECGDHIIAEWQMTGSQTTLYGAHRLRLPISLRGVSVVRTENGRITDWSDYYDGGASRRTGVAAYFTDLNEF
jgi:SnoaL-like domain